MIQTLGNPKIFFWKRTVSVFLLTAYIAANHFPAPVSAAPVSTHPTEAPVFRPSEIQVPEELGRIQDRYEGRSDKTIFLVQDAHAIPDAQRSIQKLIGHFRKNYGVSLVAVEGAAAELDSQFFRSFPDQERLRKVMEEYLERGELTGVSAAAILNISREQGAWSGESGNKIHHAPGSMPHADFVGVEDWPLYEEGLRIYLKALENDQEIQKTIDGRRRTVDERKKKIYPKELLHLDRALQDFHKNHTNLTEVLKMLSEVKAPERGTPLAWLVSAIKTDGSVPVKRGGEEIRRDKEHQPAVAIEIKTLAVEIKKKLAASSDLISFNEQFQKYQTSQMTAETFALFLQDLAARLHLSIQFSDRLQHLMKNQRRMKDLEGTQLFKDFERYSQRVKESLFTHPDQKRLDAESRRLDLVQRLADFELTREDWNEMKSIDDRPWTIDKAKSKLWTMDHGLWTSHFAFYRNAEARERAMLKNLLGEGSWGQGTGSRQTGFKPEPRTLDPGPRESSILVAGGFHTEGFLRLLKERGISYVLVVPRVGSIPQNTNYRDLMKGSVSWKHYFQVENGKVNLYDAFVRATRDKLVKGPGARVQGPGKLVSTLNPGPRTPDPLILKSWRDQILRDLAMQGAITKAGEYTRFLDELSRHSAKSIAQSVEQNGDSMRSALSSMQPAWLAKVDRFIDGLRTLDSQGRFTEQNILNLFTGIQQSAFGVHASTMLQAAGGNADLARGTAVFAGNLPVLRSEVREGIDVTELFRNGPVAGKPDEVLARLGAHAIREATRSGGGIDVTDLFRNGAVTGRADEVLRRLEAHAMHQGQRLSAPDADRVRPSGRPVRSEVRHNRGFIDFMPSTLIFLGITGGVVSPLVVAGIISLGVAVGAIVMVGFGSIGWIWIVERRLKAGIKRFEAEVRAIKEAVGAIRTSDSQHILSPTQISQLQKAEQHLEKDEFRAAQLEIGTVRETIYAVRGALHEPTRQIAERLESVLKQIDDIAPRSEVRSKREREAEYEQMLELLEDDHGSGRIPVRVLVQMAGDKNLAWNQKQEAVRLLGIKRSQEARKYLLERVVRSEEAHIRTAAASALEDAPWSSDAKSAAPTLVKGYLEDTNDDVSSAIWEVLLAHDSLLKIAISSLIRTILQEKNVKGRKFLRAMEGLENSVEDAGQWISRADQAILREALYEKVIRRRKIPKELYQQALKILTDLGPSRSEVRWTAESAALLEEWQVLKTWLEANGFSSPAIRTISEQEITISVQGNVPSHELEGLKGLKGLEDKLKQGLQVTHLFYYSRSEVRAEDETLQAQMQWAVIASGNVLDIRNDANLRSRRPFQNKIRIPAKVLSDRPLRLRMHTSTYGGSGGDIWENFELEFSKVQHAPASSPVRLRLMSRPSFEYNIEIPLNVQNDGGLSLMRTGSSKRAFKVVDRSNSTICEINQSADGSWNLTINVLWDAQLAKSLPLVAAAGLLLPAEVFDNTDYLVYYSTTLPAGKTWLSRIINGEDVKAPDRVIRHANKTFSGGMFDDAGKIISPDVKAVLRSFREGKHGRWVAPSFVQVADLSEMKPVKSGEKAVAVAGRIMSRAAFRKITSVLSGLEPRQLLAVLNQVDGISDPSQISLEDVLVRLGVSSTAELAADPDIAALLRAGLKAKNANPKTLKYQRPKKVIPLTDSAARPSSVRSAPDADRVRPSGRPVRSEVRQPSMVVPGRAQPLYVQRFYDAHSRASVRRQSQVLQPFLDQAETMWEQIKEEFLARSPQPGMDPKSGFADGMRAVHGINGRSRTDFYLPGGAVESAAYLIKSNNAEYVRAYRLGLSVREALQTYIRDTIAQSYAEVYLDAVGQRIRELNPDGKAALQLDSNTQGIIAQFYNDHGDINHLKRESDPDYYDGYWAGDGELSEIARLAAQRINDLFQLPQKSGYLPIDQDLVLTLDAQEQVQVHYKLRSALVSDGRNDSRVRPFVRPVRSEVREIETAAIMARILKKSGLTFAVLKEWASNTKISRQIDRREAPGELAYDYSTFELILSEPVELQDHRKVSRMTFVLENHASIGPTWVQVRFFDPAQGENASPLLDFRIDKWNRVQFVASVLPLKVVRQLVTSVKEKIDALTGTRSEARSIAIQLQIDSITPLNQSPIHLAVGSGMVGTEAHRGNETLSTYEWASAPVSLTDHGVALVRALQEEVPAEILPSGSTVESAILVRSKAQPVDVSFAGVIFRDHSVPGRHTYVFVHFGMTPELVDAFTTHYSLVAPMGKQIRAVGLNADVQQEENGKVSIDFSRSEVREIADSMIEVFKGSPGNFDRHAAARVIQSAGAREFIPALWAAAEETMAQDDVETGKSAKAYFDAIRAIDQPVIIEYHSAGDPDVNLLQAIHDAVAVQKNILVRLVFPPNSGHTWRWPDHRKQDAVRFVPDGPSAVMIYNPELAEDSKRLQADPALRIAPADLGGTILLSDKFAQGPAIDAGPRTSAQIFTAGLVWTAQTLSQRTFAGIVPSGKRDSSYRILNQDALRGLSVLLQLIAEHRTALRTQRSA